VALRQFADGVWTDTDPVRIVGMQLSTTMTVLRLGAGELMLHSPIAMTPERQAAVEALGTVAHLFAPNLFHHRWVGDWAAAYPAARLHAPPGLLKKRPDLTIARLHTSEPDPAFAGVVDVEPILGVRLNESALIYRPARVLVVADLVHNVGQPPGAWARFYTRAMGFYDRVALSKMLRWTAISDRDGARTSVDRLLTHDFDRLIVGHGAPVDAGGKQALAQAYTWLPCRATHAVPR
jgi:hypothetical protein